MSEKPTPEQALAELKEQIRSVLLSTLGEDGNPHTGYTPFIFDGRDLIIFVSQLSLHTRDLLANAKASAMLIADESTSSQIFARTRVSYQCNAVVIAPHEDHYAILLEAMQGKPCCKPCCKPIASLLRSFYRHKVLS